MNDTKINKLILKSAYITIIILIIAVIALIILKYNVEGEKNMPFKLSNIIVISSAEGYQESENKEYIWDAEIYQKNDIYLNIEKNINYKETEIIKSIEIENIKINEKPKIGELEFYRVSKNEKELFLYEEQYEIKNNLEFIGDINTDLVNLKISNQGGTILIRALNKTGKKYASNDEKFEHDGKLLNKVGIANEEIKSKIQFDLVLNLESGISFRGTINLELPIGNINEEGISSVEINNMKDIVFKRK